MEKKVLFVTGAASGLGKKMGETFLNEGYRVVFSDVHEQALGELTVRLQNEGFDCHGVVCDVTKEMEIYQAIDETIKQYGRIDVLVNNAGLQHVALVEDFPTDKFKWMIEVMLTAPFMATKKVFPLMKKQRFGRILNMASINGVIGFAGKAAYNSAKHGVIGLTKVTALEGAAHGITVNAICPGYVDTPLVRGQFEDLARTRHVPVEKVKEEVLYPLVPQKRLLGVEEIANYAVFLASDQANGITGQACIIDGGYTTQ